MVEVVVRLSEDDYKYLKGFEWAVRDIEKGQGTHKILGAILDGIVLPKNHGRLIDAEAFNEELDNCDYDTYNDYSNTFDWIEEAPTIIEADREVDND